MLSFGLSPEYQTEITLHCRKCKQNKYVTSHNNRHGPKTPMYNGRHVEFLRLPERWDDGSEMWFKTFCILITSKFSSRLRPNLFDSLLSAKSSSLAYWFVSETDSMDEK